MRGLYPIIDTAACRRAGVNPVVVAEAVAESGIETAQFRHKGPFTREILEQAEGVKRILQSAGSRCIINDRADVALMLKADGVHLGQEDLPPTRVRRLTGPAMSIGFSTHTAEQLQVGNLEPVDYLAVGPVFATSSKENPDPALGLAALPGLRRLTAKPLVAIGGITRSNAAAVLSTGVDAVAVISDLLCEDVRGRVQEWLRLIERTAW